MRPSVAMAAVIPSVGKAAGSTRGNNTGMSYGRRMQMAVWMEHGAKFPDGIKLLIMEHLPGNRRMFMFLLEIIKQNE